ncbi:MAG: hypothetical protein UW15_C0038G0003 [Parcubacteria group bacterium GW2011_GWC1_44_10]|uniref:Translation elongation factor-like protein n=1 Tax=Candidatus Giovannonibacteria bacterium GW2011_GWA1_44_25 TaxID=1618645 RepID=A0A0G1IJK4_9BACT|nr:MAG: hypothetical protein US07_C0005G0019 [Candidatus Levybacteria bacterium GW2011_GWB1_36_18]KKT28034.1 MAG: hypothetical protein UW15_C0038G0003 [Parcubacteria group bacterium GW2011_GWC1_44_10]KKT59345.1 MAG: hypothetical protein UW53_C0015G0028 [Candidatus Giovannonibacteria bacterium GW2011_GWA1_44_25]
MEKEVGKITHWYDKIGVAVIDLKGALKMGDRVKIKKGEDEFEETISSMQVDHKEVSSAKKGDEVAVKLSQKAKEGAAIYKAG